MSSDVVSLAEWRLSRQGIKITFFKAVIKQAAITSLYPGGLEAFVERYQHIDLKQGLVATTFMSLKQVDDFVAEMRAHQIREGFELAIANQIEGVVTGCEGIEFVSLQRPPNVGTHMSFPVWYACADLNHTRSSAIH